jgi:hypothetical protein
VDAFQRRSALRYNQSINASGGMRISYSTSVFVVYQRHRSTSRGLGVALALGLRTFARKRAR